MTPGEIATMLWQDDCLHELRIEYEGRPVKLWIPCASWQAYARMLASDRCEMSMVPRTDRKSWATRHAPALWAVLQSSAAATALQRFRPAPTLVVRSGRTQQRVALWALWRPLQGAYIEQATERLSYALHGLRRAAGASSLVASPFSAPNFIEFETSEIYSARDVVGHLRDAPAIDGWRRRAA